MFCCWLSYYAFSHKIMYPHKTLPSIIIVSSFYQQERTKVFRATNIYTKTIRMSQHNRTNLPVATIDAVPPLLDPIIIMLTTTSSSPSSPTSASTAFFGQHLLLDDSFESIDTVSSSSSSSSSSFSLKQRKSTRRMKNHKHNFDHHPHHHYHHHYHHRNDFLFCGPNNENGGFLANATSTPKQQQSTNMDLPPQHSSSGRPIIEFTFVNKDDENNNNADNVIIIPERLLVPLL